MKREVPRSQLSAAGCGGIAVYLPKPRRMVLELPSAAMLRSTLPQRCGAPLISPHAQLIWQLIATSQWGLARHGPHVTLRQGRRVSAGPDPASLCSTSICLGGCKQMPGGSLVGLGVRLAARCVGEELLPLRTCHLFPRFFSVNGPLNSKPREERWWGISGYVCTCKTNSPRAFPGTAARLSPWEFLALPWCDFGLGQLALIQAIFAHGLGVSLGQGQSQQDLAHRLPIYRMCFTAWRWACLWQSSSGPESSLGFV